MMWPTMRRTVAIAFVVQGHDYGPSQDTNSVGLLVRFLVSQKLRLHTIYAKCKTWQPQVDFCIFLLSFAFRFLFFINKFLAKMCGKNH